MSRQRPPYLFRAMWPITDHTPITPALLTTAAADVPLLATAQHAILTGPGRFTIASSETVPGSGRITEWVLVYEAPAKRRQHRTAATATRQGRAA